MIEFSKKNSLMDECLQRLERSRKGIIKIDYELLNSYLCGKIEKFNDMCILSFYNNSLKLAENGLQNHENTDEIEGSLSKLHISDLIDKDQKKLKKIEYLRIGVFVSELLYYRLRSEFSIETFVINVSYNIKGKYKDCVVRFHQLKNNSYYNDQSYFENFKNEALGIILTR